MKERLELIALIVFIIIIFAATLIFDNYRRSNCEEQGGTYIQENLGLGNGKCILNKD